MDYKRVLRLHYVNGSSSCEGKNRFWAAYGTGTARIREVSRQVRL